jgi:hypothetical protein
LCTKLSFSSKIRTNKTVDLINHKIFLSNFKSSYFANCVKSHFKSLYEEYFISPFFFMTIHLRNVTNSLTGSLCRPEFFLIIFLPIDSLLRRTVSTTSVIYHRTHLADFRTVSLSSVFNVSTAFIYLFIYSVCNDLICLVQL